MCSDMRLSTVWRSVGHSSANGSRASSFASARVTWPTPAVSMAPCRLPCADAAAAGSSMRPISPDAKITSAPLLVRSNRPVRCDQMKTSNATKDSTKADCRMATVFMAISVEAQRVLF